ncbi:TPR domain-containing protein [Colletotrichum asianum]
MNHQNLDLANAIEALQLESQGSSQIQPANLDVDRPSKVDLLASSLLKRFVHTQSLRDINQAIDLWTTEINRNHIPGPLAARRLESLGECFSERARVFDSEEDLKRAVQLTDEAINGMPLAHPNYPDFMMSLANRLNLLSSRSRSMNDLNRAVHAAEVAAVLTLEDHPLRPVRLEVHGAMLCERSERTGSIEDLRCAIGVLDMGLQASPDGHPVALGLLGGMGRCLGNMYDYTGFLGDLDKSIECLSAAVAGMSRGHPHITIYLNLLGTQLSKRHEHTGSMDDIDHSIKTLQKTLDMIPEHNPLRLTLMINISASLLLRYSRTGAVDDLQNAIDITDSALRATPPGHEAYAACSANLGAFLSRRYERFRSIDDLDRANDLLRTAVALLPEDDPRRPLEMNNLASGLFTRFLETQSNADLDEAIDVLKRATTIIPENHPERAMVFENLVRCYYRRGQHTVDDQMRCSLEGWNSRNSPPSIRIAMAFLAAGLLNRNERYEESSQILEDAVSLLPSVSPRALKGSDQQHMLQKVPGLASLASSTALHSGKSPVDAIRLLESGRGIMAGLLFETRTKIEGLKQSCPQLADEFSSLRDKLDSPSSIANPQLTEQDTSSWETQAKQRRELESRFNEVVAEIRTKPGFEDFLLPPKAETLLSAASSGPIVVLNATFWRCDAIIINSSGIQLLPLPRFGLLNIEGGIQFSTYSLESMWDVIARPILDHLGFIESPKDGNFPHVWWILTGSLSRLPIHAAGYHYEGSSETVIDRVVSSYSTSIKALLQSRQNSVRNIRRGTSHKACLVSVRTTPSQGNLEPSDLEFAEQEIQTINSLLSPAVPTTLLSQPEKDDVLLRLESCTAFHFAGHGITDSLDPSKSSLLLNDWVKNPLTVEDLTALRLFEKSPWLSYLSACSTGDNQAERLQDESIHLVSACQLAGFPHVVGSLWKIDDECSAEAAAEVYRTIVKDGWTDESVARGVHNAARLLRKKTTGEMWTRRVKPLDSRNLDVLSHGKMDATQERPRGFEEYAVRSEGDPSIWAAYIHVGP